MTLRSRETERRLRREARRRIRRSAGLRARYRFARPGLLRWIGTLLARPLGRSLGGLLLIVAPLGLAALSLRGPDATTLVLALTSELLTLASLLLGAILAWRLQRSPELKILSPLPLADSQLARMQQRAMLRASLLVPFIPSVAFYTAVAVYRGLPPIEAGAAILCAVLQWAVVVAVAAALAALMPQSITTTAILASIALVDLGVFVPLLLIAKGVPVPWRDVALGFQLLLPAGWVNVAFQHGILQHTPLAFGMLIPVVLLVASLPAALERLRSRYRVREIRLLDDGRADAVLDTEPRNDPTLERIGTLIAALAPPQAATPPDVRRQPLSRGFLREAEWWGAGWIERRVASMLTPRERAILELLLQRRPEWTLWAMVPPLLVAALGIAVLWGGGAAPGALSALLIVTAVLLGAGTLVDSPEMMWKSATGESSPCLVHVPVGCGEARRAFLTDRGVRGICAFLAITAVGLMLYFAAGNSPWEGALAGARCGLVVLALQYWAGLILTACPPARMPRITALLFLASAAAAVVFVFSIFGEAWATPAAAVMFGAGWLALRYEEWRFNRAADLVVRGTPDRTKTGNSAR